MARPRKGSFSKRECRRWGPLPYGRRILPQSPPFQSGIENMKGLHRSHIMSEFSRLWIQVATAAQALTKQGAAREDEVDHLKAALVLENSHVYHLREYVKEVGVQLSSACQELHRSAVHAQHVVEAREERVVALLAAQTTEAEVERLTKLVADLQSQRLSAGPPFSWNVVGAILTDFVLNFQDQVPNLPSLLEVYKQRFPGTRGYSLFLLPSPSKPFGDS
ncbi:hypothetical protein LIER_05053 [Lithospermum erythrorhizon]|uniref:Uncharacterized protein n=1 Tax=Lithospermum erythrorhizon TaxID=34254 RepID=A0AAV3P1S4_LITER